MVDVISLTLTGILDRCPILLGKKKRNISRTTTKVYELVCIKDIFINDNDRYRNIFNPLICLFTDCIEKFYEILGSQSLYANIIATPRHTAIEIISSTSYKIKKLQVKQTSRIDMDYKLIPKHKIKSVEVSA
ncbi:28426_t:CDS:2 [Dentiscutata erythropus]|uniref:28426_t:CDS:1 n=1 Tax=Dentiscutata erythropus TaxID=1348616 RepID=A0A9N9GZ00_9GLOM|nr:28426_t:CDS:2 [Dentiscutata erythropus]